MISDLDFISPFQTIQGDKALGKLSLKNYTFKLKIVQFLKAKPNQTKKTNKKPLDNNFQNTK